MKNIFSTICIVGMAFIGYGQEVLSSSGGHFEKTNIILSHTVGEVITFTGESGNAKLTQGFHQNSYTLTLIKDENPVINFIVKAYPNPVANKLKVELPDNQNQQNYIIKLIDVAGKEIGEYEIIQHQEIDLTSLPSGNFFLHLINESKESIKVIQLTKN